MQRREPSSDRAHEPRNAPRRDAAGSRREIDCTAGWSRVGRSWRWHGPWVAIRWSTDERRTQTAIASARVRGLLELCRRADPSAARAWRTRTTIFVAAKGPRPASPARVSAVSAEPRTDQTLCDEAPESLLGRPAPGGRRSTGGVIDARPLSWRFRACCRDRPGRCRPRVRRRRALRRDRDRCRCGSRSQRGRRCRSAPHCCR
jgi:hypothetical protein